MTSFIRLETDAPTPELQEKARKELRETPEVVNESVEELRKLLRNDKTLFYRDDDDVLIPYLRPVKFYPESAYALMKRAADFKKSHKALIKDLTPDFMEELMTKEDVVNVLSTRDQDGRRVMIQKAGKDWDTKKVSADQVFQLTYLIHLGALLEPATQINGVVIILDFDGMGMSQVRAMSPSFSLRLLSFIQDVMPLRLKEVHIVNQPFIFNLVWKIFQPLVKPKLKERLHFHGSKMEKLHEFISPAYLPANYGGSLPKIDYASKDWFPHIKAIENYIKENNSWGLAEKS